VLSLSEVREMKALRVERFNSERVTDDGEMKIKLHDRDGILCVKYVKYVYCDDEYYYIVPHDYYCQDKCFKEIYRDFLVDLPANVRKMKWIVVGYERARCRDCFTLFKPTIVRTELHGDVPLFTVCPRCGSSEWDLVTEDYFEVHEQ
jgi:Zn finger protein HypA/HybF involved in hydrogenase expression